MATDIKTECRICGVKTSYLAKCRRFIDKHPRQNRDFSAGTLVSQRVVLVVFSMPALSSLCGRLISSDATYSREPDVNVKII